MRILFFLIVILIFSITTKGCYKDNEEELYPIVSDCDTADVSYSGAIEPLVSNFCYACHSSTNYTSLGGGVELEGYSKLKVKIEDSSFVSSVIHDGKTSFMPKNSGKLNDCNLAIIKKWIEAGALEN